MQNALSLIFRNPGIRIPALTVFFYGTASAATLPYQSIIGIKDLKLDTTLYSVVMFLSSLISVAASISIGILSDRSPKRRPLIMILALCGVAGFGLVYAIPSQFSFIAAHLLLIPLCSTMNSVLYGTIRMTTNTIDREAVVSVNSTVRALFSASWILVPGILGAVLSASPTTLPVYLAASISALVCFFLYFAFGKVPSPVSKQTNSAAADFRSAIKELTHPRVLFRVSIIAIVSGMLRLNGVVSPLIIEGTSATLRDVGIIAGAVAFLEIPFMLMWGQVHKRVSAGKIIAVGGGLYVAYMVLLGFATAPWHFYALLLVNACGASAILSIPISYLQDLLADRPGLGSSLITVNAFLSNGVSALVFGVGSVLLGYSGTAVLSGIVGVGGVVMLLLSEGRKSKEAQPPAGESSTT